MHALHLTLKHDEAHVCAQITGHLTLQYNYY